MPDGDLTGRVTSIAIDGAAGQRLTVTFSLQDAAGLAVVGAETNNFEFQVAKQVAATNARPAYWQSYINRSDQEGTGPAVFAGAPERGRPVPVAGQPGVYTYTFCTPLAAAATFQYYGSGAGEPAGCAAQVANSGPISGAAWDAFRATLNLAYDAAATTRLTILGRDGSLVNLVQDFVPSALPALPAALSAQVVTTASCGACHAENVAKRDKLLIAGTKGTGHLGRRFQVETCVMCHNAAGFDSANSTATTWRTIDLKVMMHDLHAAAFPQSGSFGGVSNIRNPAADIVGVDTGLPAGQRPRFNGAPGVINCRTCHDNQNEKVLPFQPTNRAAADKIAWQTQISQQACSSCHDGTIGGTAINFANHFGPQADNSQCAACHAPGRSMDVNYAHTTPYSTPNNPHLYTGARIVKYEIRSVTVPNPADGRPVVVFRVLVGETEATLAPINLQALPAGICIAANCQNTNTAAGINFRLAWARPMAAPTAPNSGPAIPVPVDWNNFGAMASGRGFWNNTTNLNPTGTPTPPQTAAAFDQPIAVSLSAAGVVASLSPPDADGFHTTAPGINPAAPVAFPLPISDLNLMAVALESFLVINNYNISGDAVMRGLDGARNTLRRPIVDMESCVACHERVGFHGSAGRANNPDYCAVCHNPQVTSSNLFAGTATFPLAPGGAPFSYSQRPNNYKDMLHAIHAAQFRRANNPGDPFNFIRGNPLASGGAGPMVFQNVIYPAQVSDCMTCHLPNTYRVPTIAGMAWSSVNAAPDGATGGLRAIGAANPNAGLVSEPAGSPLYDPLKTVRIGPVTAACGSCHNSTDANIHYLVNSTGAGESCAVCHGPGAAFEAHKR